MCFVSRRHQCAAAAIPPGLISVGRVLGLLNGDMLVIRCGGGLIAAPITAVVLGIQPAFHESVARELAGRKTNVWIRSMADGGLAFSFEEDRPHDSEPITVQPFAAAIGTATQRTDAS